jgi:hypothetical protein
MDLMLLLSIALTASSIWVYCDTKVLGIRKGLHPGFPDFGSYGWFFFTLFVWIVAFPLYISKRNTLKKLARQACANGLGPDPL